MSKNKAAEFILEHSKLNENGDARSVTQTAYLSYIQDTTQITPDTIKTLASAEKELVTGGIQVTTTDLEKQIKEAKKNGDDPSGLSSTVRISRPQGPLSTELRASRTTTNPANGEKSTHHGVVQVKSRLKSMIDPEAAKVAEGIIGKLMS